MTEKPRFSFPSLPPSSMADRTTTEALTAMTWASLVTYLYRTKGGPEGSHRRGLIDTLTQIMEMAAMAVADLSGVSPQELLEASATADWAKTDAWGEERAIYHAWIDQELMALRDRRRDG